MRFFLTLSLLCLSVAAHSREWKSDIFHCSANIPDGPGWQIVDAPPSPGIAPVLAMQNTIRPALFGISVIERYRDADLASPAVKKELEALLQQFGYQFVGHSKTTIGGISWLQYPVRVGAGAQQLSGIIRYGSAGGYLFSITMVRGGGQEGSQDPELLQAAASFRMLPSATAAVASVPAPSSDGKLKPTASPTQQTAPPTPDLPKQPAPATVETPIPENSKARFIWIGFGVLFVLSFFFAIVGRGDKKR